MKISVFYAHILQAAEQSGKALSEVLSDVKKAGIEGVEIELAYLERQEETLSLLEQTGLSVSCIYQFYEMDREEEEIQKKEHEKAERHIAMAKRAGAKRILAVPGFLGAEEAQQMKNCRNYAALCAFMEKNQKVQRIRTGLQYLTALGKKEGVAVTVEDFDDVKSPVSTMEGIRWFLEHVPGLCFTLDMGNFVYSEEDVCKAWEQLKEYVVHVHCKDRGKESESGGDIRTDRNPKEQLNQGLLPVAVGDGYLPIAQMLHKLKTEGYEGYLAIEHFDAENQEICMKKSAAFLKGAWGGHVR